MSYSRLHDTDYVIQIKRGLRKNLLLKATTNAGIQAEPYYTTDTKQFFIHDGTAPQPIPSLDMAIVDRTSGNIVIDRTKGEIVWDF